MIQLHFVSIPFTAITLIYMCVPVNEFKVSAESLNIVKGAS